MLFPFFPSEKAVSSWQGETKSLSYVQQPAEVDMALLLAASTWSSQIQKGEKRWPYPKKKPPA